MVILYIVRDIAGPLVSSLVLKSYLHCIPLQSRMKSTLGVNLLACYDERRNAAMLACNSQVQEFRTGATRGAMDAIHSKEETTRLRTQIGDLRGKLAELENKVSELCPVPNVRMSNVSNAGDILNGDADTCKTTVGR